MKSLNRFPLMVSAVVWLLSGCASSGPDENASSAEIEVISAQDKASQAQLLFEGEHNRPMDTMVITARGWGAPPKQYYPEGNRRLMAMRAAKLDAYRSLAERIHGLRIWGGTTVGEMVLEQDEFKVLLDAYVVGAKVLSIMAQKDGNYEAIVEIEVDRDFLYRALADRKRKGLLNVPPEYGALPRTAYEQQNMGMQQGEAAHKEQQSESRSSANFYFSD